MNSAWREFVDATANGIVKVYTALGPVAAGSVLAAVTLICCVGFWSRGRRPSK